MADKISVDAAAQVMREAMRDSVQRHSLWYLIQGGLMIVAGLLALVHPVFSTVAVSSLLGWLLIISGIAQGLTLIGARRVPHFWPQLLSVVLSIIVGLMFLRDPGQGLLTLTILLIVYCFVEGFSKLVFALTIRPFPNWGWVCASGALVVAAGSFLWSSLPLSAAWVLGVTLGLALISEGAALAYLAWRVRRA